MKYIELYEFLKQQEAHTVRLSFAEIESLLGFDLPNSAYKYPAWWSNAGEGHSHSLAWLDAGWKTAQLSLSERAVSFLKRRATRANSAGMAEAPTRYLMDKSSQSDMQQNAGDSLFGALAGSITVLPETDLTEPLMDDFTVSESGY